MMEIVPMDAGHVPAVAALEARCFADPWSERSVAGELENPLSLWLVALEAGTVAGYVGSQTVLDAADILNLAVDPARRGRGVASALLAALEARLRAQGVRSLTLEVRPSNAPALALYGRRGFVQVGCRRGYYRNPREDAWLLRKEWNE